MISKPYTTLKVLTYIQSHLHGFYPGNEIKQFEFLIFNHLLSYSKIDIHLNNQKPISDEIFQQVAGIVSQLKEHKPIQYILGKTEFFGINMLVNENVLIPRPETEELVKWILDDHSYAKPYILDIGTGSGCIALALASNCKDSKIEANDISMPALNLAKKNAAINNVNILFFRCDIFNPSTYPRNSLYDVIVSNPPYVRGSEKDLMDRNVLDFEPGIALFVDDNDPLLFYKTIAEFGKNYLKPGGTVYFEINEAFGKGVVSLLNTMGYSDITLRKDISGKDRMVKAIFVPNDRKK